MSTTSTPVAILVVALRPMDHALAVPDGSAA